MGDLRVVTGTEEQKGWEAFSAYPLSAIPVADLGSGGTVIVRGQDRLSDLESRGGVPHFVLPLVMHSRLRTIGYPTGPVGATGPPPSVARVQSPIYRCSLLPVAGCASPSEPPTILVWVRVQDRNVPFPPQDSAFRLSRL